MAAVFYSARGNFEFMAYLGVTLLVGLLILATASKSGLDQLVLWMLLVWGFFQILEGLDEDDLFSSGKIDVSVGRDMRH